MKIKLLPFKEARKKAEENGIFVESNHIACINKEYWKDDAIFEATELDDFFITNPFHYPKCCCEVVEQ